MAPAVWATETGQALAPVPMGPVGGSGGGSGGTGTGGSGSCDIFTIGASIIPFERQMFSSADFFYQVPLDEKLKVRCLLIINRCDLYENFASRLPCARRHK